MLRAMHRTAPSPLRPALAALTLALAACSPGQEAEEATGSDVPGPPLAPPPTFAAEFDTAQWLADNYADMGPIAYREGRADLDGDGTMEFLVYLRGPMVCGSGGCPLLVLRAEPEGASVILETSVTQLPVGVLDTSTNGMRDLWVTTAGGGAPSAIRKLSWSGTAYPTNPTVAEEIDEAGTVIIDEGDATPVATPAVED